MPIRILGVEKTHYNEADKMAYATAEKWMNRIPELFITERSHQKQIGISEVGSDCRKCVARKLALVYKKPSGGWFPFIGTAVHQALEDGFARWEKDYHLEGRIDVWEYKDLKLGGSCDMAALANDGVLVVNDWKVIGENAFKDVRKGKIKDQYRIQAMLYGLGWKNKGYDVTHVALSFLPRDSDLPTAEVIMLRFDEQVALDSLDALAKLIDAAEIVGWAAVIEKQPKASFCWDCKKYEQSEYGDISSLI
jgi:hypothetical protein